MFRGTVGGRCSGTSTSRRTPSNTYRSVPSSLAWRSALSRRGPAPSPKGNSWVLYGILVGIVVPVAPSRVKHVTLPCCFALFPPCSLPGPSYFQSSRTTKVDLLTPKMDLPWTTTRTTLPRGHWLALLHRRS